MEKHKQEEKMRYQTTVKQQVTLDTLEKKHAKDYKIIHKNILCVFTIYGHRGKNKE